MAGPDETAVAGGGQGSSLPPEGHAHIGPYRLLEQIGEGGFGVVWKAEQREPFRREVAIKLIKPGMDSRPIVARFEAERQALAFMDHPGVARVLDGGVTRDGRPYFVMEFVRGEAIAAFCDKNRLSVEERLRLFIAVCEAVQHAHTKGVVHRDLKPSNILVAYDAEGRPQPKVIDFGVAKALHQPLTEHTLFTERGQLIGTPEYMSPEQAEMAGTDIDTRSDIYSLGVMLYELLTGARPFEPDTLRRAGLAEIVRIIREVEPPRPSTKLASLPKPSDTSRHPSAGGEMPSALSRQPTAGGEKPSAGSHRPAVAATQPSDVSAQPTAAGAQLSATQGPPSVRRQSSTVGQQTAAGQITPAMTEAQGGRSERNRGGREAGATGVGGENLSNLADRVQFAPSASTGADSAAEERGARSTVAQVAARRRSDPRSLSALLRRDLDWVVMKCLEKDRARRYETANALAMELRRYLDHEPVLAGPPGAGYRVRKFVRRNRGGVLAGLLVALALLGGLAGTTIGFVRAEQRRAEALAALAREAVERRRADEQRALAEKNEALAKQHADETRQVAEFQSRMLADIDLDAMGRGIKLQFREQVRAALERQTVGEYPNRRKRTAEELNAELAPFDRCAGVAQGADVARRVLDEYVLKRANQALTEQFANQPLVQAQIRRAIGTIYQSLGLYAAAEPLLRTALATQRKLLGERHREVAGSLSELAGLMGDQGDYAAAESLYIEALALHRELLGDEHPDVARDQNNLALQLINKGDYAAAESLHREALATLRKVLGNEHPDVAACMINLASLLRQRGDADSAEGLLREALAIQRKKLGNEHPDVANSLDNLAQVLKARGDYAAAEPLYRDALAIRRRFLGDEHPGVASSLQNLAGLLQAKGDYAAAESLYRDALTIFRKVLGEEHSVVATSLNSLATLYQDRGDYAAAESLYREGLAMRRRLLGDEHPDVAANLNNLASVLQAREDYAAAEPLHREALAMARKLLGDEHPYVATSLNNLAYMLDAKGDYAAAEPVFREALAIYRKLLGDDHVNTQFPRAGLGHCLVKLGRFAEAQSLLVEADARLQHAQSVPQRLQVRLAQAFVKLYKAWDQREPGQGYDARADEWRRKLAALRAAEQSATPATPQSAGQPASEPAASRPSSRPGD